MSSKTQTGRHAQTFISVDPSDMIGARMASATLSFQLPTRATTGVPAALLIPPQKVAALKPNIWRADARFKGLVPQLQTRQVTCIVPHCIGRSNGPEEPQIAPEAAPALSPAAAIAQDFYSSLNKKNFKRLHEIIAKDCTFEDLTFSRPFKGEQVHQFLKELAEAMGEHVKFITDSIYEGKESSVAVRWHLEWQQKQIPFATGCTFYYFSANKGKLCIEKVCVYVESPVKPGEFVLEVLKLVSSLFDKFPNQAKWFLEKPQALIQFVAKAYKILIEPFILPLLVYYTHLWTYGARILSYLINLLQYLLRIFM